MLSRQRVSLILAASLFASLLAFISATYSRGDVSASTNPLVARILRRHDKKMLKPTRQELDSLRSQVPAKEERLLENMIPRHVTLGIKIRKEKEKEFKDLKNENWAHDFELEVTNTGDKPIYAFYLLLVTDVKATAGFRIVAPVYYGRMELGTISTLATPDDIPLKPGESVILKIHPGQLEAWDYMRRTEHRPHPKKIQVRLEGLSFGDGTGYGGEDGVALPRKPEQSNLDRCIPQKNKSGPQPPERLAGARRSKTNRSTSADLPAIFLPVNFWSADLLKPTSPKPEPTDCCPGANCTSLVNHVEHPCVNCPNQNRPTVTYCSDPAGSCYAPQFDSIECYTGNGQLYLCQTIAMPGCGGGPMPTPTPSPSPSPSPEPTCDPATKPNNTNCICDTSVGSPQWLCFCSAGVAANYLQYPGAAGGCDQSKTHNNGSNCCVCNVQTCPDGSAPDTYSCQCPTPTPGGGGPDPNPNPNPAIYKQDCVDYYWVHFVSYDGGQTWSYADNETYAGCYYEY